jgi:hypothetical protein
METKKCSTCGEVKPINEFYKQKSHKDGCQSSCKNCRSQWAKLYYQKKSEEIKNRVSIWADKNKGKVKIYKKESYLRNYEKNRHKYRERNKLYYQKKYDKLLKERQKRIIDLADRYIKDSLIRSGWDKTKLNPEIIEEKRNIIKVKRVIKKINESIN